MILEHLSILDFKNIAEAELDFSPGVNCMLGANGMGKSNLLEAIHLLSMARPMRSMPENALIRHGCESLLVKGRYAPVLTATPDTVACGITAGKGKRLKLNGKEYSRMSEHVGRFPLVTVAPDDSDIIRGPGSERRRLMDMVVSQADPTYLPTLILYNRALESRNRMLRAGVRDKLLYESVENVMALAAVAIHAKRLEWTEQMTPLFTDHYRHLSGGSETASMGYVSILSDFSPEEVFEQTRQKDQILGFTSKGIHRDELMMRLADYDMRRLGSQGQMKTFTIALRFSIFDYMRRHTGKTPALLLDDIFDKLDASRVSRIIETVSRSDSFGQIFITDTNRRHLDDILAHLSGEHRLFEVEDGRFSTITDA